MKQVEVHFSLRHASKNEAAEILYGTNHSAGYGYHLKGLFTYNSQAGIVKSAEEVQLIHRETPTLLHQHKQPFPIPNNLFLIPSGKPH
jgi:hypothetical protein